MRTKYTVEGSISKTEHIIKDFDTLQEADEFAKQMADKYRKKRFFVNYPDSPNHIHGLDDHHWQYDDYFKMPTRFCHND